MKAPLYVLNRVYHPHGFTWHVMRNNRTGELRSQHRPHGAEPYSLGKGWTLVRSVPHNPALKQRCLEQMVYDGLETKPKTKL